MFMHMKAFIIILSSFHMYSCYLYICIIQDRRRRLWKFIKRSQSKYFQRCIRKKVLRRNNFPSV
jgi:hypothetical protein